MSAPVVVLVDRNGNSKGALDDAVVNQVIWNLNDVGTAEIVVPTLSKVGAEIELMKTEFQIWINGNLQWQGFPETLKGDSQLITYECSDLLGYFKYRFVTNTSLNYTSIDQLTIMEDFVAAMQSGTNQSFGIAGAGVSPSGFIRSRNYDRSAHQNAIDILKEFPTLNSGADFSVECVDSFGIPQRAFTPWYPSKGSFKPNFALEWGKNILTFNDFAEDGTKLATLVYATGGSDATGLKIENFYEDTDASTYYAQFQAIVTDGSELDPSWLLAVATQNVLNRNRPVATPTLVTVSTGGQDLVSNLKTGDSVPVFIDLGRIQVPGDVYRITQATYKADGTYTVVLARIPIGFVYPPPGPVL